MTKSPTFKSYFTTLFPRVIKREVPILCLSLATIGGSLAFHQCFGHLLGNLPVDWWWFTLLIAILQIPAMAQQLQHSRDPWLVRLANAFSQGFFALLTHGPDIFKRLRLFLAEIIAMQKKQP